MTTSHLFELLWGVDIGTLGLDLRFACLVYFLYRFRCSGVSSYLIQHMNPTWTDNEGMTLLHFACRWVVCPSYEKAAALCNTDSLRTHVRRVHQLIGWHYDSRLGMQLKDPVLHAYTCISLSFPALYSSFIVATSKLQKLWEWGRKS